MYSPGPNIATSFNIGFYFHVEDVGHTDQNYLKKLCFAATVSEYAKVSVSGAGKNKAKQSQLFSPRQYLGLTTGQNSNWMADHAIADMLYLHFAGGTFGKDIFCRRFFKGFF